MIIVLGVRLYKVQCFRGIVIWILYIVVYFECAILKHLRCLLSVDYATIIYARNQFPFRSKGYEVGATETKEC